MYMKKELGASDWYMKKELGASDWQKTSVFSCNVSAKLKIRLAIRTCVGFQSNQRDSFYSGKWPFYNGKLHLVSGSNISPQ